jgi:hypothetical protein
MLWQQYYIDYVLPSEKSLKCKIPLRMVWWRTETCRGRWSEWIKSDFIVCGAFWWWIYQYCIGRKFILNYFISFLRKFSCTSICQGPQWRSWLRYSATNRKAGGSIPDGVIGIFHWHKPSGRTMALGSTQPLTEMSTRNISWWIKAAGA